jgi:anti-sigma factor RsiW
MIKCWRYRRIISRSADDNTPLPSAVQAHLAQCPDCHRLHQTEHEIARQLSAGAAAQKHRHPPNFIHTGIMARIAASSSAASPVTGRTLFRWPVALAGIVLVLTSILLWPGQPRSNFSPVRTTWVQPGLDRESVALLELPNTKDLTQWATNPDQPLQTEVKAVVHDARGAMTALADNFFPEKLRQSLLNPPSVRN